MGIYECFFASDNEIKIKEKEFKEQIESDYYLEREKLLKSHTIDNTFNNKSIRDQLKNFKNQSVLNIKSNVLEFYKEFTFKNSKIAKIANLILCIPATQVSVERSFSDLKYVYGDLRSNLDAEIIHCILFLRITSRFNK